MELKNLEESVELYGSLKQLQQSVDSLTAITEKVCEYNAHILLAKKDVSYEDDQAHIVILVPLTQNLVFDLAKAFNDEIGRIEKRIKEL